VQGKTPFRSKSRYGVSDYDLTPHSTSTFDIPFNDATTFFDARCPTSKLIAAGESVASQVHLHSNRDGTLKDIGVIPGIRLYDSQSIPTAGFANETSGQ
jgi:hypothetical protein